MNHTDIIVEHFTELCDLTNCSARFLDRCRSKGVLTKDELTSLENTSDGYDRKREFYKKLENKDEFSFREVLGIMMEPETKQHSGVIYILKQAVPTDSTRLTAPKYVEQNDVHWICAYLIDDGQAVQKQEEFYGQLGLKLGGLFDLTQKSKMSGTPSYTFFTGCLSKWISMSDKSTTTFQKLDEALRNLFLTNVADVIQNDTRSHGKPLPLPLPNKVENLAKSFGGIQMNDD